MSYRMKITLPDPIVVQFEDLAAQRGEPISRIALQMVSSEIAKRTGVSHEQTLTLGGSALNLGPDRRAAWIEPFLDLRWRVEMWGSIVALHARYPRALSTCRMAGGETAPTWRRCARWLCGATGLTRAADDPRHELAFHAQLTGFSRELRQEGGSITSTWQPGASPEDWIC